MIDRFLGLEDLNNMSDKKQKKIEIARSFSYKMQIPETYENRDFFASAKAEVVEKDAVKMSEKLDIFVQDEVMKSVFNYKLENAEEIKVDAGANKKEKDKGLEHCTDTLKEEELKDQPF